MQKLWFCCVFIWCCLCITLYESHHWFITAGTVHNHCFYYLANPHQFSPVCIYSTCTPRPSTGNLDILASFILNKFDNAANLLYYLNFTKWSRRGYQKVYFKKTFFAIISHLFNTYSTVPSNLISLNVQCLLSKNDPMVKYSYSYCN